MMKLSLAEPSYLKDSVTIISELVNEATFKITSNAIELVAMDPANVAMVVFKLLSSAFVEYELDEEKEIAINLNSFKQILRRAKSSDTLVLSLEEGKLKIALQGKSTRTFFLPLIDLEEREQRIPDLQFPVKIETTTAVLNDAIDDADVVGESVSFIAEPSKFTVLAEGDLSKAKIEIPADDDTKVDTQTQDKIRAKYSVEYLKKMITASKISPTVSIQFNKDYPLRLEYKSVDKVLLSFVLAPRVEND